MRFAAMHNLYCKKDLSLTKEERKIFSGHLHQEKLSDNIWDIFDEWVAYQDATSKEIFYTRVLPYLKAQGKLVINIAHDYSYEDIADRILRMQDGKII